MMLQIIRAARSQLPVIHELAYIIWPKAYKDLLSPEQITYMLKLMYSMEELTNLFEKEGHRFLLAMEDEHPVGFALYHPKDDEPGISRLNKLYVLPELNGKGIGKKLMDFIVQDISHRGFTSIELNVKRNNPAVGFYKRLGFEVISEVNIDIGSGYFMNDYIMARVL